MLWLPHERFKGTKITTPLGQWKCTRKHSAPFKIEGLRGREAYLFRWDFSNLLGILGEIWHADSFCVKKYACGFFFQEGRKIWTKLRENPSPFGTGEKDFREHVWSLFPRLYKKKQKELAICKFSDVIPTKDPLWGPPSHIDLVTH